ncbi:tetrapyrrole biosynthesis uroporphyrinogen III synthase [Artomyces pyxidatus]|uniref:Tetrapyrrole biosynthesis uroporphyrinogen III synthase n=1 Tax=Artomyces pyxidatus TaxID=48021 RepID=A0ACB8T3N4_9AGAM|nr:tetrapyrrole biosynthesis uroporphyrinogen III synthase [Artomyces pyxidatus]
MNTNVLLLRAPTHPTESDAYTRALLDAHYTPISIPVLETVLVNNDELARRIRSGPQEIKGVVVTSARGAEGWGQAVQAVSDESGGVDWRATPFYTVGEATAAALAALSHSPTSSPSHQRLFPCDIRGAQTGTAAALARYIVEDQGPLPSTDPPLRMLYLTGDKNRDTLPRILHDGGIELDDLQVYATQGSRAFETDLQAILKLHEAEEDTPWWIAFFAPSAAAYVLPHLRVYFDILPASAALQRQARIAAIGPTTGDFLRSEMGVHVDAVAERPSAEGLVRALRTASDTR